MLIAAAILIAISVVIFFTGMLLAPNSINISLKQKHGCGNFEILQIPHIFQSKWYEPSKLYVKCMVCYGGLGLLFGFILLFILAKFNLA